MVQVQPTKGTTTRNNETATAARENNTQTAKQRDNKHDERTKEEVGSTGRGNNDRRANEGKLNNTHHHSAVHMGATRKKQEDRDSQADG